MKNVMLVPPAKAGAVVNRAVRAARMAVETGVAAMKDVATVAVDVAVAADAVTVLPQGSVSVLMLKANPCPPTWRRGWHKLKLWRQARKLRNQKRALTGPHALVSATSVEAIAVSVVNALVASEPPKAVNVLRQQTGVRPVQKDVAIAALTEAVARKTASVQRW